MDFDMADVRPSVLSLLIVTLLAMVGIVAVKFLTQKFYVPGLTELAAAV